MSKQPEDKETLRKQLDDLKKNLEDFESDKSLDQTARKQIADAARETVRIIEEKIEELP